MSYTNIPINLPEHFLEHPTPVQAPLTKVQHISGSQTVIPTGAGPTFSSFLTASQVVAPVLYLTNVDTAVTLPDAQSLLDTYGSNNRVQLGDVFVVPVYNFGGGTVSFVAGPGGSGSGGFSSAFGFFAFTFTNITFGSTSYVLNVGT